MSVGVRNVRLSESANFNLPETAACNGTTVFRAATHSSRRSFRDVLQSAASPWLTACCVTPRATHFAVARLGDPAGHDARGRGSERHRPRRNTNLPPPPDDDLSRRRWRREGDWVQAHRPLLSLGHTHGGDGSVDSFTNVSER